MQQFTHNNQRVLRDGIILPQDRSGFSLAELLAVVVIIGSLLWLILPHGHVGPPPEYHVERGLRNIEMALALCVSETGEAPTTVEDLPQLVGTFLDIGSDPSRPLAQMVTTGHDYWGNPLQIRPIKDDPDSYTLRSLGPNGVLDIAAVSDDIVISYTASAHSKH